MICTSYQILFGPLNKSRTERMYWGVRNDYRILAETPQGKTYFRCKDIDVKIMGLEAKQISDGCGARAKLL
jgi:hypothetical protein